MHPFPSPLLLGAAASGGSSGHRYWGISVSQNVGGNLGSGGSIAFNELEFYDSTGALLSYTKTAAAKSGWTAGGTFPSFTADNATDGDISNSNDANVVKYSGGSLPFICWVDFGSAVDIAMMRVVGNGTLNNNPKDYALVYSDDASTFTTVASATGVTTWDTYQSHTVSNTSPAPAWSGQQAFSSTQWRITCYDYYTNLFAWAFSELEMYETIGGSRVVPSSASATSTGGGSVANLYDNNDTTYWADSGQARPGATITYTFSSAKKIAQIGLRARNDAGQPADIGKQMPSEVLLEWYDGSKWRFADYLIDGNASYAAKGELRKFSINISQ